MFLEIFKEAIETTERLYSGPQAGEHLLQVPLSVLRTSALRERETERGAKGGAPSLSILRSSLMGDIIARYSEPARKYHTIEHLDKLAKELSSVRMQINNWNTLVCSVAYHDIIYDVLRTDNEEESAAYAALALKNVLSDEQLKLCQAQILATKHHELHADPDTNYFIDADLSILGGIPEKYDEYVKAVRFEYRIYSDPVYYEGRKKVLKSFLRKQWIYKTQHFRNNYEGQARKNIEEELSRL